MTMPDKIWAMCHDQHYQVWSEMHYANSDAYIRKDLADELARALEYEQEKGRLSVSSATILARYHAATEGK